MSYSHSRTVVITFVMAIQSLTTTRASSPLSSATLSVPPSPGLKGIATDDLTTGNPLIPASTLIEFVASKSSSNVFVYDLAEQAGFGTYTKSWAQSSGNPSSVVSLQTRAGAGLSLVGRLSQGTSKGLMRFPVNSLIGVCWCIENEICVSATCVPRDQ